MLGLSWKPFSEEEENLITSAIAEAEKNTSGEIRVHIDRWCKTDPVYKAQNRFVHLKMDQTKAKNGVLIYVAIDEHKVAIIGDSGINEKVGVGFWEEEKELMISYFKEDKIAEGLSEAIRQAGLKLAEYFPYEEGDDNELPDDISYG